MSTSTEKPIILTTTLLAHTHIFEIEGVHLRFSNGQERHFERLRPRTHEAVMIIPVLDNETVLLVREYGAGLEEYYLGFPKGTVDQDEDILAAANRELMEEIGYGAKKMQFMNKPLSSAPSYNSRLMKIVIAMELFQQRLPGDEPEPLEVVPWNINKLQELLKREDFHEARSIAAFYMIRDFLQDKT